MKVVIVQVDTLPPVLPVATSTSLTDSLVLYQSGTSRTASLALVMEALMAAIFSPAVNLAPAAATVGTSYDEFLPPVGLGPTRKMLAIQNTSSSAGIFVFFGASAPEDNTQSWPLGPGQSWPPAGVNSVSQDGVWLCATAADTPVVILVG